MLALLLLAIFFFVWSKEKAKLCGIRLSLSVTNLTKAFEFSALDFSDEYFRHEQIGTYCKVQQVIY